jgi:hypothetical protein
MQHKRDAKELTAGDIRKATKALRRSKGELAWLINFVQREPAESSKNLQKCRLEMLAFCMTVPGPFPDEDSLSATAADVDRIAEALRVGISHVVSGDEEAWVVPGRAQSRVLVGERQSDGSVTIFDQAFHATVSLETRMAMVAQALIMDNQAQVRICAREGCGRLFVKIRRQEFCSIRCSGSQRKRNWRARGSIRAEENRLRREAYLRKLWRKENDR